MRVSRRDCALRVPDGEREDSVIGIDEAVGRVLAAVRPVGDEEVDLLDALGRTLAEEIVAREDVPPFANSAMDGFAVRGEDLRAGVREFVLVDEVPAGYVSQVRLAPGQAAKIMTGAPLPEGADTVVQVELTEAAGATVSLRDTVAPAANVRAAGEDLRRGETVFAPGQGLGPAEIGLLASLGCDRVRVARRPRVAILATGSELVPSRGARRSGADPQLQLLHRLRPGAAGRRRAGAAGHRARPP